MLKTTTKLVVVDDEEDLAEFVADVADGVGFDATFLSDPHDFAEHYSIDIGVFVFDLFMPGIDGIEATADIGNYVKNIQEATDITVDGIHNISEKVSLINSANSSISAAVEQQSAATNEITRNIEEASAGTAEVTTNISMVTKAAQETGQAAGEVSQSSSDLKDQSQSLAEIVDDFLIEVKKVV